MGFSFVKVPPGEAEHSESLQHKVVLAVKIVLPARPAAVRAKPVHLDDQTVSGIHEVDAGEAPTPPPHDLLLPGFGQPVALEQAAEARLQHTVRGRVVRRSLPE